jgi:hypothetical protein
MMSKSMRDRPDAREVAMRLDELQGNFSRDATFVGGVPLAAVLAKTSTGVLPKSAPTLSAAKPGPTTQQAIDAARGPRRWPMAVAAVVALLVLGVGVWVSQRPDSSQFKPSPPEVVKTEVPVEQVAPRAEVHDDDLAPLTSPVASEPVAAKAPTVVALKRPTARVVEAEPACDPDAKWRDNSRRSLSELRSMAAVDPRKFEHFEDSEASISAGIKRASTSSECNKVELELKRLLKELQP